MKEKVWILDSRNHKLVYAEKVRKTDAEWREALTPEQFDITAGKGTERPFTCTFDEIKKPGLYRCVRCGNDLFNTATKFDSGTGWPSYFSPVSEFNVAFKDDDSLGMRRTEVLCARCDAHLGHVFDDGPPPTGKRYCINSAALEFTED